MNAWLFCFQGGAIYPLSCKLIQNIVNVQSAKKTCSVKKTGIYTIEMNEVCQRIKQNDVKRLNTTL